jgi:hypothetical protein
MCSLIIKNSFAKKAIVCWQRENRDCIKARALHSTVMNDGRAGGSSAFCGREFAFLVHQPERFFPEKNFKFFRKNRENFRKNVIRKILYCHDGG